MTSSSSFVLPTMCSSFAVPPTCPPTYGAPLFSAGLRQNAGTCFAQVGGEPSAVSPARGSTGGVSDSDATTPTSATVEHKHEPLTSTYHFAKSEAPPTVVPPPPCVTSFTASPYLVPESTALLSGISSSPVFYQSLTNLPLVSVAPHYPASFTSTLGASLAQITNAARARLAAIIAPKFF